MEKPSGSAGGYFANGNYEYVKSLYVNEAEKEETFILEFEGIHILNLSIISERSFHFHRRNVLRNLRRGDTRTVHIKILTVVGQ